MLKLELPHLVSHAPPFEIPQTSALPFSQLLLPDLQLFSALCEQFTVCISRELNGRLMHL